MNIVTKLYFLVGAGAVLAFAVNYFNQPGYKFVDEGEDVAETMLDPVLPKHLTDRFQYTLYLFAYVLVTELIYLFLVLFLPDLLNQGGEATPAFILTRQNIVLSAFIITGLAPNLPYVRQILERSKLYLHEKAQIPKKGREVYHLIKSHQPHYAQAEVEQILLDNRIGEENARRTDLIEADFVSGGRTLSGRWAKLSYLFSWVERWAIASPFRNYIGHRELQYNPIQQACDTLRDRMEKFREGTLSEADRIKTDALMESALHRTYRLISCLLYLAGKTDAAVDQFLDQLGYAPVERKDFPIPWKNMVYVIGAIITAVCVGGFVAFISAQFQIIPLHMEIRTDDILRWCGFSIPFLTIPVLWVLFVKRCFSAHSEVWPVVTESEGYAKMGDRPWHLYVIVGLTAYCVGGIVLLVSVLVDASIHMRPPQPLIELMRSVSVWSSVVFVTALFAAYRLDSAPDQSLSRRQRMDALVFGALFQGLATMAVIYFASVHTFGSHNLNAAGLSDAERSQVLVYCIISFCIGFFLYFASGFGSLRQRRDSGRRRVNRPVFIQYETARIPGNTINISPEGALIETGRYLPEDSAAVRISDKSGNDVLGRVVKHRGNYIHLYFQNRAAWEGLWKGLEIPAPA